MQWKMANKDLEVQEKCLMILMIKTFSANVTMTTNQTKARATQVKEIKSLQERSISKFQRQQKQFKLVSLSNENPSKVRKVKESSYKGELAEARAESDFQNRLYSSKCAIVRNLNRWMSSGKYSDRTKARCRLANSAYS